MMGPYHASLVATVVGAARAALDELEEIAKARTTRFPPGLPWYQHVDVQRPFGQALMLTDTAEAILMKACETVHGLLPPLGRATATRSPSPTACACGAC